MITIKLPIKINDELKKYINQYNSVVRYSYNRFTEKKSMKEIKDLVKTLNNIDLLDVSIIDNAILKAQEIYSLNKEETFIFGDKKNFFNRIKNLISKDQFKENKNIPLTIYGRSLDKGNRKFISNIIDNNQIIFKPSRQNHFELKLPKLNKVYKDYLNLVEIKMFSKEIPVTIGFDYHHIYITFDELIIQKKEFKERKIRKNRILSLDLNPNYVGLSVIDWLSETESKIIHKEVISIKNINDIKVKGLATTDPKKIRINNKRCNEVFEISKHISKLALHYECESLALEKLNMESKDLSKGKNFNRLINNLWNRNKLYSNLKKRCRIFNIKFIEILPQYSSFIGQLTNPEDVDSVAASIEISRRANLFNKIYLTKEIKKQNIIFPEFNIGSLTNHWKEELKNNLNNIKDWKDLYYLFKKSKLSYRFLYDSFKKNRKVFRLKSYKSLIDILSY